MKLHFIWSTSLSSVVDQFAWLSKKKYRWLWHETILGGSPRSKYFTIFHVSNHRHNSFIFTIFFVSNHSNFNLIMHTKNPCLHSKYINAIGNRESIHLTYLGRHWHRLCWWHVTSTQFMALKKESISQVNLQNFFLVGEYIYAHNIQTNNFINPHSSLNPVKALHQK